MDNSQSRQFSHARFDSAAEKRGACYRACWVFELVLVVVAVLMIWGVLSLPIVFFYLDPDQNEVGNIQGMWYLLFNKLTK